jgi:hypothetical protein
LDLNIRLWGSNAKNGQVTDRIPTQQCEPAGLKTPTNPQQAEDLP